MLVIKNANIYSVNLDGSELRADAVAADGRKIVYIGRNCGVKEYKNGGHEDDGEYNT